MDGTICNRKCGQDNENDVINNLFCTEKSWMEAAQKAGRSLATEGIQVINGENCLLLYSLFIIWLTLVRHRPGPE